jgi:hypothetical protein
LGHICAELEVRLHCRSELLVSGQVSFAERLDVDAYESVLLLVTDSEMTVDVNDVLKAEFTGEAVGSPERLGGEPSEMGQRGLELSP